MRLQGVLMFGAIPIQPPPRLLCVRCLWPYGVALSPVLWLAACAVRCQLAAVLVPLLLCRGVACSGGAVSGASGGCFAVRGSPPKSLAKSPGKSRKSLA